MIKIAKFGGSSVADAEHFKKIKAIVDADPARRFVVVSACGRRFKGDTKVTDLLYLVNAHVKYHVSCEELLEDIGQRYFDIADELGLTYPIREEFAAFAERARSGGYSTEELVSRGEYFTARLMAEYLGLPFLDAATVVAFHHDGTLSMNRTSELVQEYGQQGGFVMPGFYGATREGQIKLLDRGGGDISGSILAKCLGADLYENWTDVSGFYSADPRIVPEAQPIARVTYEELRELSYMGASVLHEEAVFPVREAGIPLVIKNTNAPQDPGTIISETADEGEAEPIITGVTGKRGFVAINVARDRTKPRVGFMRRALVVCLALSVSTTALGVFLQLRRMSLMGDALSHAILPGVAVGYLLSGMSLLAMSIGGFIAGITVALVAGLVSRRTPLKEDASFAGFYLGSLALGVTLVSLHGSNVDLLHLLFGSILAVDKDAALFVTGVCMFTLITLALFYRGLVTEAFDTAWLQVNARWLPGLLHGLFLALLVLNLVAGFQVLGTLMAVGLMMLPAIIARLWARTLAGTIGLALALSLAPAA